MARGRPATGRPRVLAELYRHHLQAGWDAPIARGELLARLQGWTYGPQQAAVGDAGDGAVRAYVGVDAQAVGQAAYDVAQTTLSRTLLALFGEGLLRVGTDWEARLVDAGAIRRELEDALAQDLADPGPAYQAFLDRGGAGSLEAYLDQRRVVVDAWRRGEGRPSFRLRWVALSEAGHAAAAALVETPAP